MTISWTAKFLISALVIAKVQSRASYTICAHLRRWVNPMQPVSGPARNLPRVTRPEQSEAHRLRVGVREMVRPSVAIPHPLLPSSHARVRGMVRPNVATPHPLLSNLFCAARPPLP